MIWMILPLAWSAPVHEDPRVDPPTVVWSSDVGGVLYEGAHLVVSKGVVAVGLGASSQRPELQPGLSLLNVESGAAVGRAVFDAKVEVVRVTALDDGWATFDSHSGLRRFSLDAELLWTTLLPSAAELYACAPIALDGELFAQRSGLYAVDARTGAAREVYGGRVYPPCARVDTQGDGSTEWLHGTGYMRLMTPGETEPLWALEGEREGSQHDYILGDFHAADGPEVGVITAGGTLLIRSLRDGSVLEEILLVPTGGKPRPTYSASWFQDAGCFVAGGTKDADVVCASRDGVQWVRQLAGRGVYARPLVADLDGRPGHEVLVATHEGELVALDAAGRIVWTWHSDQPLLGTPLIGDFVGDEHLEILVPGRWGEVTMLATAGLGTPLLSGGPEDETWPRGPAPP